MTREEAHRILSNGLVNAPSEHEWCMAFRMAIQALDQDSVLDKIRAEIEKPLRDERCFDTAEAKAQYIALNWCIEIIDKYKEGEI